MDMKRFFAGFCALFLLLLLTPALAFTNGQAPLTGQREELNGSYYLVKNAQTGEVMKLSPLDYIKGVVAAEMPLSYHTEALKAQAVAAHSYALYRINQKFNSSSGSGEAYLSTDPAECQGYLDLEGRKASGAISLTPMRQSSPRRSARLSIKFWSAAANRLWRCFMRCRAEEQRMQPIYSALPSPTLFRRTAPG